MEKTIRINGSSRVMAVPDMIELKISFNKLFLLYEDAAKRSGIDLNMVKDIVESLGLERKSCKTSSFSVRASHSSKRDKDGNYYQVFNGYEYDQSVKITIPKDNKMLGRIIYSITNLEINGDINLRYFCKDSKKYEDEALREAILDCRRKAEIIAKASGVGLGDIIHIDYTASKQLDNDYQYERDSLCSNKAMSRDSYDIDIDPMDIEIGDDIYVEFMII